MNSTITRIIATAAVAAAAFAGTAITAAGEPGKANPYLCHGKQATKVITKTSQLEDLGNGTWEVLGTSASDVIVVDVELGRTDTLLVSLYPWHVRHSNAIKGGTDDLCANLRGGTYSWNELSVYGGSNVTTTGAAYTTIQAYGAATYDITGARVSVSLYTTKASTVKVTNEARYDGTTFTQVAGSRGADDISVTVKPGFTEAYVAVTGDEGDDTITVDAPAGAQTLLVGGKGADTISSGASADLVYGAQATYSGAVLSPTGPIDSFAEAANALLNGRFSSLHSVIGANGASDTSGNSISTGSGDDRVYGSDGADEIRVSGGSDWADGLGGRDRLWGGEGDDTLYGGTGDDDVYGENGDDTLYGGSGDDLIKGGKGNDTIRGQAGADTLSGNEGADDISGSTGNDTILGDDGDDYLRGNDGDDSIDGGKGTDDCSGGAGSDTITGCNP